MATDLTAADWAAMRARCKLHDWPDGYWDHVRENIAAEHFTLLTHAPIDLPLALDALARQQEANARLTKDLRYEEKLAAANRTSCMTNWDKLQAAEAALADRDATIARLRDELVKEELLHDEQLRRALTAQDAEIARLREALEQIRDGMNIGAVAGENFALMLAKIRTVIRAALTPAKEADRE